MSQTGTALMVKFLMTLVFAGATLVVIDGNRWGSVALVAVIGTALNYVVGDLLVLPAFGNVTAALGDGVLAGLVAYAYSFLAPGFITTWTSLGIFAVLIAVGEYFFHQYLLRSKKVAP